MQILVTRFHLLILTVTLAITAVAYLRVPADYAYPAHWAATAPDWLWPRDLALPVAPVIQVIVLLGFFALGRALTKNHYAKTQHILDPAVTLLVAVPAAIQLGLLFTGTGSDLDFIRITAIVLGATLIVLGIVLFEAERHTYAGLRMPWRIHTDRAWTRVHRSAGSAFGLAGVALLVLAWLDAGIGSLVVACLLSVLLPPVLAALLTVFSRA